MEKEKLLHERLRGIGTESCTSDEVARAAGFSLPECAAGKKCDDCFVEVMRKLADEMERCYIPRPRFEDGEPVQFGGEAQVGDDLGEVCKMVFTVGGCEEVMIGFEYDSFASHYMVVDGEFVKRPAPKVLDADGVETKGDDTVWTKAGLKRRVAKVGTERCHGMEDWDGTPWVMFDNDSWMHAHDITHREPDSLDKLRDDMAKFRGNTYFAYLDTEKTFDGFIDRLTALIKRGAR